MKFENSLFTIRFVGEELDVHGIPIYDLGLSLISFQRLLHKSFLLENNRLYKGAFPNREDRRKLALQIGKRERKSDAYALIPLVTSTNKCNYWFCKIND